MNRLLLPFLALFSAACNQETQVPAEVAAYQHPLPEWAKNATIYEVNIRQYTPEGTINAFASHLPRLKKMGADILWIMPVQPIGTLNRKGPLGSYYSISDYTAVNPEFGTLDDFKALVDSAHKMGMYVILDWVANHTAFDHVWTQSHPNFYTHNEDGSISVARDNEGKLTDWTDVADLNYDNMAMRRAMINDMKFWLTAANIDGFRCDVAGFVPHSFWQQAVPALDSAKKDLFMLAEWEDPALHDVFNMTYGWEFHHYLNLIAKGDTGTEVLDRYFAKLDTTYPDNAIRMFFTTNHDENSWNGTVFERMPVAHKAFFTLCATYPQGMPLVYSGQEAALNKRLRFFDKDTISWTDTSLVHFYTKTLWLKKNHPALENGKGGTFERLDVGNPNVYAFKRQANSETLLVYLNFTSEDQAYSLGEVENSSNFDSLYEAFTISNNGLILPPGEAVVLYSHKP